jgi:hypothetical protein
MIEIFTIVIPSCDRGMANKTEAGLKPLASSHFDGTGYPSMSKLMNDVLVNNPTEVIVVATDRVRAKADDVFRMLELLEQGYAMAHFHPFGFFATEKEVFRRIGLYDERYVGGNWEDSDIMLRLREENLAIYEQQVITYDRSCGTRWQAKEHCPSQQHFRAKWVIKPEEGWWGRRLQEDPKTGILSGYDLGPNKLSRQYLTWEHSVVSPPSQHWMGLEYRGVIE